LYYKTDISFIDSIVGKEVVIPYFKEKITIHTSIFGVISNGKNYLLEGKGMPVVNTANKGNMFVEFAIQYPKMKANASANTDKIEELRTLLNDVFYV
jgi:DnaJ-class molecular chaperone